MKIFRSIKTLNESNLLQEDLCRLIFYCDGNNLYLNIKKCNNYYAFSKNKHIIFNYKLEDNLVIRLSEIRDLNVYLENSFTISKFLYPRNIVLP